MQPAKSQIILTLFNAESPNFTQTFILTQSRDIQDMTSPAASGRQLLELENDKRCHCQCLGSNFSSAAYSLPQRLVGFLFQGYYYNIYLWLGDSIAAAVFE